MFLASIGYRESTHGQGACSYLWASAIDSALASTARHLPCCPLLPTTTTILQSDRLWLSIVGLELSVEQVLERSTVGIPPVARRLIVDASQSTGGSKQRSEMKSVCRNCYPTRCLQDNDALAVNLDNGCPSLVSGYRWAGLRV